MSHDEAEEPIPIEELVECFVEEGGGDIEGFLRRYPERAAELREILPAIGALDEAAGAFDDGDPLARMRSLQRWQAARADLADGASLGEEEGQKGAGETQDGAQEALARIGAHVESSERYRKEGEIGRGGQGTVLAVWDAKLRRHLAMKVALASASREGTASPLARFLEEANVTSQLDHPGIVPLHDAGLDAEQHVYFTMKLVKGRDLLRVFDQVARGEEDWTQARALGALLKVCEAMAYAHSKGVIHRDLKPSNVMVGRFGEVFVMDWGLARVEGREDSRDLRIRAERTSEIHSTRAEGSGDADSPLVTLDGDVVGTPAFMSPEQARGDVAAMGPQSDVYAVGAMLYQLLAGQMPYVPGGARLSNRAVWGRVLEGPPERLSSLVPSAPAELVAICEKAMAREPRERYVDMSALATDLRASLEGRVVLAFETGAIPELRKWVTRNRGLALASAAAVVLALGGSLSVGFVQARERTRVEEQRDIAEAVQDFLTEDFLGGAKDGARPGWKKDEVLFVDLLDSARARLEEASLEGGRFADKPLVQAAAKGALGWSYSQMGRVSEALPLLERAHELRREHLGAEHEDTLQSMVDLGTMYAVMGKDEALELLEEAVHVARSIQAESSVRFKARWMLANAHLGQGHLERALDHYQGSYAEAKQAGEVPPTYEVCLRSNMGLIATRAGDLDEAEGQFREAHALAEECLDPDDAVRTEVRLQLGKFLSLRNSHDIEAECHLREGLQHACSKWGPDNIYVYMFAGALADFYASRERSKEALAFLEGVSKGNETLWGAKPSDLHPGAIRILESMAEGYRSLARPEEERRVMERLLHVLGELAAGPEASSEQKNAYAMALLGDAPEDLRDLARAYQVALEACRMTDFEVPALLQTLALACHARGDSKGALDYQTKALGLLAEKSPKRSQFKAQLIEYTNRRKGMR